MLGPAEAGQSFVFTTDSVLNFCQIAVLTCQRAQGDKSKVMRESWVRLCGTYQSRGGVLAANEMRVLLNEISTLYFAIPPPKGQAANPFGDMMSAMFGGAPSGGSGPQRTLVKPKGKIEAAPELD